MALTKVSSKTIQTGVVGPKIANVQIANSAWSVLDDTAVDTAGGYIIINGSNFTSGCEVSIDGTAATSVSRVSDSVLRVQVPAKSAGSYTVYVVNTDGGTALRINGLTYSGFPAWVTGSTLTNQSKDVAISVQLSATGATTYTLQDGSSLPAGTTLASNGLFSGTVTGIETETTYSFTVVATDAENQDSPRTFSVTVTVNIPAGIYGWGNNAQGQLGLNDTINRSNPTQIGTSTDWSIISVGEYVSAAIKTNGTLWTWGSGNQGASGHNNTTYKSSPTQVGSLTTWSKVSAGRWNFGAIKTDGTLWMWGWSNFGRLGLNDNSINRSSPTQVGTDTNWSDINAGNGWTFGIKTNGTLWAWGNNGYGNLGLNSIQSRSSPVQVGTGTTWSKVSSGKNIRGSVVALKTDGTLWAWGYNVVGVLGHNDLGYKSSPVQIGSGTTWTSNFYNDGMTVLATKTDGSLWSWGSNNYGKLGLNDTVYRSSPTQVGTDTNWSKVATSQQTGSGAIRTNGTLWMWGQNNVGMLGLNDSVNRSSPVQVGTSSAWNLIDSSLSSVIARTV